MRPSGRRRPIRMSSLRPSESAMAAPETPTLARIRRWLADAQPGPDAELLRRFAAARDEEAFAALVDRHG
jgi:hypothetical protein